MAKVSALSVNRIALFGFILTLFYFFNMYDNGDSINQGIESLNGQIAQETAKKVETEGVLKKEEEMRADVKSLANTYESVKAKIPLDFTTSELRTIVDQISSASNLRVLKLSNVESASSSGGIEADEANLVEKVAINYTFQGNYGQIHNFMSQLAAVEKIIKVSELKIRTEEGTNGPSTHLTVDAIVVGYRQASVNAKPATNPDGTPVPPQPSSGELQ